MEGLQGKVVVFAGAGGIADATAAYLGANGAKVVIGDVSEEAARRAVAAAQSSGGEGIALEVDISDELAVKAQMDTAIAEYGRIDGLFNVAANISVEASARDTTVVDIEMSTWNRAIEVNLTGYLLAARHAIPHMLEAGGGSVVNTISGVIYGALPDKVAYQVTKAGVSALTRNIARSYGKAGIRANNVSPGLVLTETGRRNLTQEYQEHILATITPLARLGQPSDLASTVAFLLSDLSEWVTGQVLCVDGGQTMRL